MKYSQIDVGGAELRVAETGEGRPVLFCHGFPAVASVWRSQMQAVAAAGWRAIAPDMRGYGGSSAPADADAYTPFDTVGDLVGLLDRLEIPSAVLVGHDFGASVAWNAAMMRPDRFSAVFGLSVPFRPPGRAGSFLDQLRAAGRRDFYMFAQMGPKRTPPGAMRRRRSPASITGLRAKRPTRADGIPSTHRADCFVRAGAAPHDRQRLHCGSGRDVLADGLSWSLELLSRARSVFRPSARIHRRRSFLSPPIFLPGPRTASTVCQSRTRRRSDPLFRGCAASKSSTRSATGLSWRPLNRSIRRCCRSSRDYELLPGRTRAPERDRLSRRDICL